MTAYGATVRDLKLAGSFRDLYDFRDYLVRLDDGDAGARTSYAEAFAFADIAQGSSFDRASLYLHGSKYRYGRDD